VRLAKQMAQTYYGSPVRRTYWTGFSGGGHMGWTQALFHPEEYDGLLINSPANHWQKFRLADVYDETVRKKVAQQTTPLVAGQMTAVVTAARAACDPLDGVVDTFLADPRRCTWSARANICGVAGAPAAPNCLNEIQAAAVDRMYDGPRNRHGKRIWHAYDLTIGLGTGVSPGSAGVIQGGNNSVRWALYSHDFDVNLNLYEDQESIDLAAAAGVDVSQAMTYDEAAQLVSQRTSDYVDADFVELLGKAHERGVKIIVTHGTSDGAIQWRNAADMYTRAASYFSDDGTPDYAALQSWYRFFAVPGLGHAPVNALPQVIDWVENGVAPDRIERTTGFRVICPFPQEARYLGGDATDPNSFACGGNLQTNEAICIGLKAPYKSETSDRLRAYGGFNPSTCAAGLGDRITSFGLPQALNATLQDRVALAESELAKDRDACDPIAQVAARAFDAAGSGSAQLSFARLTELFDAVSRVEVTLGCEGSGSQRAAAARDLAALLATIDGMGLAGSKASSYSLSVKSIAKKVVLRSDEACTRLAGLRATIARDATRGALTPEQASTLTAAVDGVAARLAC
jgi:hypothetical protein